MLAPPLIWPWIVGGAAAARDSPVAPAAPTAPSARLLVHHGKGALADAKRDFARIDELALIDAGERGRYVALNVDVLREYLAARIPEAALSLTSTELLAVLAGRRAGAVAAARARARRRGSRSSSRIAPSSAHSAREIAAEARGIVDSVEEAVLHRAQTAAEARAGGLMDLIDLPAVEFASP